MFWAGANELSCDHGNDDYYDDYYWHRGKCVTTFITDYINTNLANSEVYVTLCGCMYLLIKDFVLLHSNHAHRVSCMGRQNHTNMSTNLHSSGPRSLN